MKEWVAFFSQTGSDIYNLSKKIGRVPDRIATNKPFENLHQIHKGLVEEYFDRLFFMPSKPTVEEYNVVITNEYTTQPENCLVTLHGYLRIVPPTICEKYEIYNLHPAPLTIYPQQKGKDPQLRCFQHGLEYSGNTIHRCTSELDGGPILLEDKITVKGYTLDKIFTETHRQATEMWFTFLQGKI